MHKHDGLSTDELAAKGFTPEPDGRMRLRTSWKAQCKRCLKWFGRTKGDRRCWLCFDYERNQHVWSVIRAEKQRAAQKQSDRRNRSVKKS
jgi:hypothetical protein